MIELLAQHRVASNLAMIMMVMAGFWAMRTMPTSLDPPMNFPMVWVEVEWRGASAEDIEELVTVPIEQQLRTVTDVRELTSRTEVGFVRVSAEFHHGTDMTIALDRVKQRVSNLRNLPPDIEPPVVRRFIDLEPIASVMITAPGDISELIPLVRSMERDLLSRGIAGVFYDGLPEEEIALLIGGGRLRELGLTLEELAREVARVSRNVPAGMIGRGQGSRQLRSLDQRRDPLAFEQLYITSNDQLIRLGDIADVVQRPREGQPEVTSNGAPAIEMMLWRSTEFDAHLANDIFENWLADVRPTLPSGVEVAVLYNIWDLLGTQLGMIFENGAWGLLLVIGILFLFLNGRVGFWVMIGIPVSFLLSLAFLHSVFGIGISIIALIAFVMALGIVVDDAIVVGEDTVTHFEAGMSPLEAAITGARRMWVPVMTSSMTTLAAFIPLLIIGGPLGEVILTLPAVLLCVIAASLIECFLVLPGHLKATLTNYRPPAPDSFRVRFDTAFARLRDKRFQPLLKRVLDYPGATTCAALGGVIVAISLIASQHVGFNLVTGFDFESLAADVEFSAATTDAQQAEFLAHLETTLDDVNQETNGVNLRGFSTKRNLAKFDDEKINGAQFARIEGSYVFEEYRTVTPNDFADAWREKIHQPAYVERLTVGVDGGSNNGEPDMTLVLRGDSLSSLKSGAEALALALSAYPGLSNVTDDLPYGREQIIFSLTPTGRALGLTSDAVGGQLRSAYSGARVQIFNQDDAELEVTVMLPNDERGDLYRLQQFPIRTPSGEFVPLANVAELANKRGIDTIRHTDGQMSIRLSADVDEEVANAMAVVEDVEENIVPTILDRYNLKFGLGGKSEQDKLLMDTLTLGAGLTLVLIYLILAWVFASYLWPLAIMTAIPFGLTGAVLGHWVLGWDFGAMSLLAFFSLTGIVVNDSIVLISFFKRDVDAGVPLREALEHAVTARFRAVLLTSLTTIAGLMPMMFETSTLSMYMSPIAITLCFGLAFATALVLLVIPALILLLESLKAHVVRLGTKVVALVLPTSEGKAS